MNNGIPREDPELAHELALFAHWIHGKTLNAGCGKRYVNLGADSIRLDINPAFATAFDLLADVHHLPFPANTFDTVVSIAVLEHTRYAWDVAKEFHRILKPGGHAVVAIPFMQPQHGEPHDYVRFTDSGIRALMEWASFDVLNVQQAHPFSFNAEWMLRELLAEYPLARKLFWPVRRYVFPRMRRGWLLSRPIISLQSTFYVIARKP